MDRYSYYSNHNIEARREKAREERRAREEQRRAAAKASLSRPRHLGDMLDTENQRLRNERALDKQDARTVILTGVSTRVDVVLPDHTKDEIAMDIPKAPTNRRSTLRLDSVRDRLDEALVMHGIDGITPEDAFSEQDEMANRIDVKRHEDITTEDTTQEEDSDSNDEEIVDRIPFVPVTEPEIYHLRRNRAA